MTGSIRYHSDRNRWSVYFKRKTIYKYNGHYMPCTAFKMKNGQIILDDHGRPTPDRSKCKGYQLAQKLLSLIQGRWEQSIRGECKFRIEEFTKSGWTDTIEYYNKWIDEFVTKRRKPATVKAYRSYSRNWIEPFFTQHPVRLHEIEFDLLVKMMGFIIDKLRKKNPDGNVGKTALNVMSSLKKMMTYARKSNRIPSVPPFPSLEDYNLKRPEIKWLTREQWDSVYNEIPPEHRPIFMFLQLHFRRPGEACAIHKSDFDPFNESFKIHRAISARQLVDSVKTNWKNPTIHYVACDPRFLETAKRLLSENPDIPFLFCNPRARKTGRYSLEAIRNVWYKACDDAGVDRIWPYRGTKHTACTNFIEEGGSTDDLMILTGHKSRSSAEQYREITLHRIKKTQEDARARQEAQKEVRSKCVQNEAEREDSKVISIFSKRSV